MRKENFAGEVSFIVQNTKKNDKYRLQVQKNIRSNLKNYNLTSTVRLQFYTNHIKQTKITNNKTTFLLLQLKMRAKDEMYSAGCNKNTTTFAKAALKQNHCILVNMN